MREVKAVSSIGNRIKLLRGKTTRAKFSEMFDVASSTLARWEADESQPDLVFLLKLVGSFDITLEWLVTGVEPSPEGNMSEQQLKFLENYELKDSPPSPKTANKLAISPVLKTQHSEITDEKYKKPLMVGDFSDKLDLALGMAKELQEKLLSLIDENAALREKLADLREERAEVKAALQALTDERDTALEEARQLREAAPGGSGGFLEPPTTPVTAASAAPETAPGSEGRCPADHSPPTPE